MRMDMYRFEVGKSYRTRSIGDHDCIIDAEVIARTEKTVRVMTKHDGEKTFRIKTWDDGIETIAPWGRYSMSPTITAENPGPWCIRCDRSATHGVYCSPCAEREMGDDMESNEAAGEVYDFYTGAKR